MPEKQTPIDRSQIPLNRVLGLPTAILLVAGIMIGSGAFKKIAPMSQSLMSEPWILIAWVIAGMVTLLGAFTYAGLASMTTQSGGVYEYLRLSYGKFFAFLFGWMMFTIGGSGAIAALAFVFAQSVNHLIPLPDPFFALKDFSIADFIYPFASSGVKLFAILIILILNWINYRGVKNGGILNNIVTAAKILGIALLIIMGLLYVQPAGVMVPVQNTSVPAGLALFSALFGALLSALWAYDGWANITYITGEIKNPQKNVPIAITGGVIIAMTLYILVNYAYMQVLPISALAAINENEVAAAKAAGVMMGDAGTITISILIMICTFGAVNACIMVYPRLYYRMAQEGSFFKKAAFVHPVFRTPYISLLYSCIWSSILVLTGTFDLLTNLVIFTGFLFFGAIAWGLIRMKRKGLITTKVIGYPFTPIIIILFSAVLVINTVMVQPQQSLFGLLLVSSGVPLYYYFNNSTKSKK
ncbi:MAG: APC family permease [Chitinophagaceae bacterium]